MLSGDRVKDEIDINVVIVEQLKQLDDTDLLALVRDARDFSQCPINPVKIEKEFFPVDLSSASCSLKDFLPIDIYQALSSLGEALASKHDKAAAYYLLRAKVKRQSVFQSDFKQENNAVMPVTDKQVKEYMKEEICWVLFETYPKINIAVNISELLAKISNLQLFFSLLVSKIPNATIGNDYKISDMYKEFCFLKEIFCEMRNEELLKIERRAFDQDAENVRTLTYKVNAAIERAVELLTPKTFNERADLWLNAETCYKPHREKLAEAKEKLMMNLQKALLSYDRKQLHAQVVIANLTHKEVGRHIFQFACQTDLILQEQLAEMEKSVILTKAAAVEQKEPNANEQQLLIFPCMVQMEYQKRIINWYVDFFNPERVRKNTDEEAKDIVSEDKVNFFVGLKTILADPKLPLCDKVSEFERSLRNMDMSFQENKSKRLFKEPKYYKGKMVVAKLKEFAVIFPVSFKTNYRFAH